MDSTQGMLLVKAAALSFENVVIFLLYASLPYQEGIIDIAIAVSKENLEKVSKQLQDLGYEFRPTFSTPDRLYFIIYLPDPEEEKRRYHVHLTYPENNEWKEFIGFRNYLKSDPEALQEYAEIKRQAILAANHDGNLYRKLKEPIFKKVIFTIQKPTKE